MSGAASSTDAAQLAVMDALVFFAAAVLISSMVLSYSSPSTDRAPSDDASASAAMLLEAVMSSSIGRNISIEGDYPLCISRLTPIRDCIAAEAQHLFQGGDTEPFAELNSMVMDTIRMCSPAMHEAHLLIVFKSFSEPLLALPNPPGDDESRTSASLRVIVEGGAELMVLVVLCPTASPELVQS